MNIGMSKVENKKAQHSIPTPLSCRKIQKLPCQPSPVKSSQRLPHLQGLLIDLFHISGFLSSGSHHSWVKFESSEWESTKNNFAFPFAQVAKEQLTIDTIVPPIDAVLETPSH